MSLFSALDNIIYAPFILLGEGNSMAVLAFLFLTVAFIYFMASLPFMKKFFHYLPPVIWCYFLPMIGSTFGIFPESNPVYGWMTHYMLPFALILLLLSADIKAIFHLGPRAIIVMLMGTLGVVIGSAVSFYLLQDRLFSGNPELQGQVWKGIGALSGSWIGGSANMTAIAAGTGIDNNATILGPFLVVDTVVGYGWMGVVIFFAQFQDAFNRFFKIDTTELDKLNERLSRDADKPPVRMTIGALSYVIGFGFFLAVICYLCGGALSIEFKKIWFSIFVEKETMGPIYMFFRDFAQVLSGTTWAVLLATAIGIILSFTPFRKMEDYGASNFGYFALFLVLTGYGARANLAQMKDMQFFILLGVIWILIHAVTLMIGVILTRSPLFFFAVGSQSNIGGPTTGSIVAGVYQKPLASVGVLLGVFGMIIGTPVGLLIANIAKALTNTP